MSKKHKVDNVVSGPPTKKQALQQGQGNYGFRLIEALRNKDYIEHELGSGCQAYTLKDESIDWLYQKKGEPLIVRQSTREIYAKVKKMKDMRTDVLITGNPGLGKTWFHNYFLLQWIPEMKDDDILVLHKVDGARSLLMVQNGEPTLEMTLEEAATFRTAGGISLFNSRKVTYLVDTGGQDANEPEWCRGWNILTSSPSQRHYKSYENNWDPCFLYYAPWELDELLAAKPKWIENEEVVERFSLVGGIPRFVFANVKRYERISQAVDSAIATVNWTTEDSWRLGNPLDLPHRIFVHKPSEDYESYTTDFASKQIARKAFDYLNRVDKGTLRRLMGITHQQAKFASMWGHLYETSFFSHLSDLSKNKKIFCMSLKRLYQSNNGKKMKPCSGAEEKQVPDVEDLKFDIADVIIAKDVQAQVEQYSHSRKVIAVYPNMDNFPTIDGLILEGSTIYGIQLTKSTTHSVSAEGLKRLQEYKKILMKNSRKVSIIIIMVHPAAGEFKLGKKAWDVLKEFPEVKVYEAKWQPPQLEEAFQSNQSLPSQSP